MEDRHSTLSDDEMREPMNAITSTLKDVVLFTKMISMAKRLAANSEVSRAASDEHVQSMKARKALEVIYSLEKAQKTDTGGSRATRSSVYPVRVAEKIFLRVL